MTTICNAVTSTNLSRFARQLAYSIVALTLIHLGSSRALAQDDHAHNTNQGNQGLTLDEQSRQSALIQSVRQATERFQNVKVAENEGYHLEFGCVSGDDFGAMGLHYVNDMVVGQGMVDVTRPQIVLYEAQPNGKLKLTGADYLVLAGLLHTARLGLERQSQGRICELAPQRLVPVVRR
jgi:hypothetical protein